MPESSDKFHIDLEAIYYKSYVAVPEASRSYDNIKLTPAIVLGGSCTQLTVVCGLRSSNSTTEYTAVAKPWSWPEGLRTHVIGTLNFTYDTVLGRSSVLDVTVLDPWATRSGGGLKYYASRYYGTNFDLHTPISDILSRFSSSSSMLQESSHKDSYGYSRAILDARCRALSNVASACSMSSVGDELTVYAGNVGDDNAVILGAPSSLETMAGADIIIESEICSGWQLRVPPIPGDMVIINRELGGMQCHVVTQSTDPDVRNYDVAVVNAGGKYRFPVTSTHTTTAGTSTRTSTDTRTATATVVGVRGGFMPRYELTPWRECMDRHLLNACTGANVAFPDPPKQSKTAVWWYGHLSIAVIDIYERRRREDGDTYCRVVCDYDVGSSGVPDFFDPSAHLASLRSTWLSVALNSIEPINNGYYFHAPGGFISCSYDGGNWTPHSYMRSLLKIPITRTISVSAGTTLYNSKYVSSAGSGYHLADTVAYHWYPRIVRPHSLYVSAGYPTYKNPYVVYHPAVAISSEWDARMYDQWVSGTSTRTIAYARIHHAYAGPYYYNLGVVGSFAKPDYKPSKTDVEFNLTFVGDPTFSVETRTKSNQDVRVYGSAYLVATYSTYSSAGFGWEGSSHNMVDLTSETLISTGSGGGGDGHGLIYAGWSDIQSRSIRYNRYAPLVNGAGYAANVYVSMQRDNRFASDSTSVGVRSYQHGISNTRTEWVDYTRSFYSSVNHTWGNYHPAGGGQQGPADLMSMNDKTVSTYYTSIYREAGSYNKYSSVRNNTTTSITTESGLVTEQLVVGRETIYTYETWGLVDIEIQSMDIYTSNYLYKSGTRISSVRTRYMSTPVSRYISSGGYDTSSRTDTSFETYRYVYTVGGRNHLLYQRALSVGYGSYSAFLNEFNDKVSAANTAAFGGMREGATAVLQGISRYNSWVDDIWASAASGYQVPGIDTISYLTYHEKRTSSGRGASYYRSLYLSAGMNNTEYLNISKPTSTI